MQQTDLFIVAVIYWGGLFLFLLYLLLRVGDMEKQLKIVENQVEGDQ